MEETIAQPRPGVGRAGIALSVALEVVGQSAAVIKLRVAGVDEPATSWCIQGGAASQIVEVAARGQDHGVTGGSG